MELPLVNFRPFSSPTIHTFCFMFLSLYSTKYALPATLGNETDKLVLQEFKSHITEDPQAIFAVWNDSLHFCQWTGVECGRKHQRVTSLDLRGRRLAGTISPHVRNLSFLQILDLSDNSFHGGIPSQLGFLIRLRSLNLSYNFIEGEIPVNLSRCSNLMNLVLNHNYLTLNIPPQLGLLSKLVKLYLKDNHLTGSFPASIGNLTLLQELYLSFNNLEGEVPDAISQMRNLALLGLSLNSLSGEFPPALYNLSSLKLISLSFNNFTGYLRTNIGFAFPNLQKLYLGVNYFIGRIPVSLSNASELLQLDISDNHFIGSIPMSFSKLQKMWWLSVGQNHLGSSTIDDLSIITSLTNCSQLQLLDFSINQFGGMLPHSITNLSTQLTRLLLGGNRIGGSIPTEIAKLVNLNILSFDLNFLTGKIPASIGKLSNLKYLDLVSNQLNGEIPSSIGNITQLLHLNLKNNFLEGSIPSGFSNFKYLLTLDLSQNKLNSSIPKQLMGLSSLSIVLNVSHNSLTGPIPEEVGNLTNLVALDVSNNRFSGEIPGTLGSCLTMDEIYMQGNSFEGMIPYLSDLKTIQYLDLSSNNLSGKIPGYMVNLSFLLYLNLSFNNLEGELPVQGVFQNASAFEAFGNTKLCGGIQKLHLQPCPVQEPEHHRKHIASKSILVIASVASCLAMLLLLPTLHWMKRLKSKPHSVFTFGQFYPKISYKELLNATGGFSSRNLIGSGNFGAVYKGGLRQYDAAVAVKVLNLQHRGAFKSFMAECQALRNIRHRNLVKVLTVCSSTDFKGNDFKALVYQYMPNGSLEEWLHPEERGLQIKNLHILQRINIAIDIASVLHYLHHQCQTPVVHCDLKPSNVLLDNDLTAHVSDFGLARQLSNNNEANQSLFSSLGIKGTVGYAAPEYGMGSEVSTQGDVYSYGILLLEMFTGRRPTDELFKDDLNLHNFVKLSLLGRVMDIVDKSAFYNVELEVHENRAECEWTDWEANAGVHKQCLISIFQIAVACSAESPRERMNMRQVSLELLSIRDKFLGIGMHERANTETR